MAEIIPVCGFCFGNESQNLRRGEPEEMVACFACGRSGACLHFSKLFYHFYFLIPFCSNTAHPSCLHLPQEVVSRVSKLRWYCIDCKTCTICHYSGNNGTKVDNPDINEKDNDLLLCDSCDRGYHLNCVAPDLTKPPEG